MIEDWFVPADFMYGSTDEDDGKKWPSAAAEAEVNEWCRFTLQICDLTGQHEPGHHILVSVTSLTEYQIWCALRDMRARGWEVERDANLMSIRSRQPSGVHTEKNAMAQ